MNCAGSVALIGDESSEPGDPALKGTCAHRIVEVMISTKKHNARKYLGKWVHVHTGDDPAEIVDSENAIVLKPGWRAFPVDEDMVNGVQIMVDEVERVVAALTMPEVFTERYLDGKWLDPRLGGTADVTAVEPFGWIHLFDYKNGYIIVEVKNNSQMKQYAVFLLHEHPDAEGVVIHLVQPNASHEDGIIRTVTYTRDELKLFEIEMKQAADATAIPNAPRRAGEWCQWCPAKIRCPEFDGLIQNEAVMDFADDPYENINGTTGGIIGGVTSEQLAQKAKWIPLFDQWAREISGELTNRVINGDKFLRTLYKLVQKKKHRQWLVTPARVTRELDGLIDEKELFTDPELKSPAQVEKLTGGKDRKLVKDIVSLIAGAPPGEIVVAPISDPREEVDPTAVAAADFADDDAGDLFT